MFKKLRRLIILIFRKGVKPFSGHGVGKFYLIRAPYHFLLSFFKISNEVFEIQGNKMYLDSLDSLGVLGRGVHESLTTDLFKKEIKKSDIVLDIGAHIGYYTLIFAKLVGKEGKIFAFEPHPNNFALLKKNVEINNYQNVILEEKAVSDKNGRIKLFLSEGSSGLHRIYKYKLEGERNFIEVESIKLDDYFKNYDRDINWIKIDIEGAEWLALQGMPPAVRKE